MERDILKKGSKHLFQERPVKYQFITDHRIQYPVDKLCKCMKVSKNSYYHWLKKKGVKKQKSSLVYLKERIKLVFDQSKHIYGSKRIQKTLEREGLYYSVS